MNHLFLLLIWITAFYSCQINYNTQNKEVLIEIYEIMDKEVLDQESLFVLNNKILEFFKTEKDSFSVLQWLHAEVQKDTPYKSFYNYNLALYYIYNKSNENAKKFFEKTLNTPDLIIKGTSLHKEAINALLKMPISPFEEEALLKILLEKHSEGLDQGQLWYKLIKIYEKIGLWDNLEEAYTMFLKYPDTYISSNYFAKEEANAFLRLQKQSSYRWVYKDPNALINVVKQAFLNRDSRTIIQLMSPINFKIEHWDKSFNETASNANHFNQSSFLIQQINQSSKVQFASNISNLSTNSILYLRSTGWPTDTISTWHFVFKKIHYPINPSIHNSWEWVGINLGDEI